jgi:hypothetical protein
MTDCHQSQAKVRRFRQGSPRLDYYPGATAMAAITRLKASSPGASNQIILDRLVEAGAAQLAQSENAVTGN